MPAAACASSSTTKIKPFPMNPVQQPVHETSGESQGLRPETPRRAAAGSGQAPTIPAISVPRRCPIRNILLTTPRVAETPCAGLLSRPDRRRLGQHPLQRLQADRLDQVAVEPRLAGPPPVGVPPVA